ncbi:BTB/POZ and MATH domain-containing protein 1 [Dichanthelium oligosanthes]|uniref:BTB/POZ and MATH domain-containing protein 1 n=1 Tax=Dichanthelium oligosanthes TaxID=888268 RepID=A0A1E5VBX9_9POAL|nr:BTB/POZ and MATH domain-containing protein 1 [Dichanthelium oligosanthes]
MEHSWTQLREVVSSVHRLKVDGFCITKATINHDAGCVNSRCSVEGHSWEVHFHPALYAKGHGYNPGLDLVFLGESRTGVTAILSAKVIDHTSYDDFVPFKDTKTVPRAFHRPMDRSQPIYIGLGFAGDDFKSHSLTMECTITVFREPEAQRGAIPVPSFDLPRHLGELLRSQAGADVTFAVSGESFSAHKTVLAAMSPVFMAEFFGEMTEKNSPLVEIQDMDAEVFKAMLYFIYTDAVPDELDEKPEAATTALAQHLLVAADRYGLDRLKVLCERRLSLAMDAGTVASTLALAEQHNCSRLKAKCIEFIT